MYLRMTNQRPTLVPRHDRKTIQPGIDIETLGRYSRSLPELAAFSGRLCESPTVTSDLAADALVDEDWVKLALLAFSNTINPHCTIQPEIVDPLEFFAFIGLYHNVVRDLDYTPDYQGNPKLNIFLYYTSNEYSDRMIAVKMALDLLEGSLKDNA